MSNHNPFGNTDAFDEASDEDWGSLIEPSNKKPQTEIEVKPEEILQYIRKENLNFSKSDSPEVKTFYKKYGKTFAKQPTKRSVPLAELGNILHVLAIQSKPGGEFSDYWTKDKLYDFLGSFLDRHHQFLEEQTAEKSFFPLHTAMANRNVTFVLAVIDFKKLKNLESVLKQKRSGENYIQVALQASPSLLARIAQRCTELTLPVWEGLDKIGKESVTPLHTAVQRVYGLLLKGPLGNRLLAKAGTKAYTDAAKIYQEWKDQYLPQESKKHTYSANRKPGAIMSSEEVVGAEAEKGDQNGTAEDKEDTGPHSISRMDITRLMLRLIDFYEKSQSPLTQVETVKLFIKMCENALMSQSRTIDREKGVEVRETPYQKRLTELRTAWFQLVDFLNTDNIYVMDNFTTDEAAIRIVAIEDPVADTIRYHCMSRFSRDKIGKCLYQPGDGKHWIKSSIFYS